MKKLLLIPFLLTFYSCAVAIGNSVPAESNGKAVNGNSVYHSNGNTMVAFNKILPKKRAAFEMLNKTVIMPAIQRVNPSVYKSLTFLSPDDQNEDGTYTFLYVASPYLEDQSYDILSMLIEVYGRTRAEEYFKLWLDCFSEEQDTLLFR
tara:strand:+ start:450 stop:896 length:447 start_codon:yes stop_codon:yes gene_type:complete